MQSKPCMSTERDEGRRVSTYATDEFERWLKMNNISIYQQALAEEDKSLTAAKTPRRCSLADSVVAGKSDVSQPHRRRRRSRSQPPVWAADIGSKALSPTSLVLVSIGA